MCTDQLRSKVHIKKTWYYLLITFGKDIGENSDGSWNYTQIHTESDMIETLSLFVIYTVRGQRHGKREYSGFYVPEFQIRLRLEQIINNTYRSAATEFFFVLTFRKNVIHGY